VRHRSDLPADSNLRPDSRPKEQIWRGYYDGYFELAESEGLQPVELLDRDWADGRDTAERCVLPYVDPNSSVLEIACGIGRVGRFVAPHCAAICCTDILDQALDECRANLSAFPHAKFVKTNGYDLDGFGDDSFDCVYSFTAFFHFDWELVVAYFVNIKRVLRPGGVAVIEFKRWEREFDVEQLLAKCVAVGGVQNYERQLDKWRYVSSQMLEVTCDHFGLEPVDRDVTHYTFRKP